MDVVFYRSVVEKCYDTAKSLFMHGGGKMWRVILLGFSVFVLLNLQGQIDLKISGDIESNPGPDCVVSRMVQGSFHQGSQRFGSTCNSLYALCLSRVKKIFLWNTSNHNHILIQGDLLYILPGKNDLLSADDLPRLVTIHDSHVTLAFSRLRTK